VSSRTSLDIHEKRKINLFPLLEFEPQTVKLTVILTTLLWLPLHQLLPILKKQIKITFYKLLTELQNNFFRMPSNAD
jgi:hypothetical protein